MAGRTYMLSRRVTQRMHLLRPDAEINKIYLYALAVAAQRCGIIVHGWVAMSNHHHVEFTDPEGNFPAFLAYMHRLIATCVNVHHKRSENVWAVEQPNVVYLVEKEDRLDKLVYILANPVSAGLVERASHWPGAISLDANLHGKKVRVERPKMFFDSEGGLPEEIELEAKRLPGFEKLTREEWKELLLERLGKAEESARKMLREAKRSVLGRKAVLAVNPKSSPKTREARGEIRPFIGCLDTKRRILELEILGAFRAAYEKARQAWLEHKLTTRFPFGTYQRVLLGAFAATSPPRIA